MANKLTLLVNTSQENAPTLRGGGPSLLGEGPINKNLMQTSHQTNSQGPFYEKVATL